MNLTKLDFEDKETKELTTATTVKTEEDFARNNAYEVSYKEIALSMITPSSLNPRKHFDEDSLQELAESIKAQGLLEPVIVRFMPNRPDPIPPYEIIAGERRWRAAKLAGLSAIPARVFDNVDDRQALEWALIENLCRRDIDPIEEAQGYARLMELGYKQGEIAEKVNRSQPAVANAVRLLKLPETVQQHISDGTLSPTHGKALLTYEDNPVFLDVMIEEAVNGLPAKEIEKPSSNTAWRLMNAGKAVRMGGQSFDKDCKDCKNRKNFDNSIYCLNPSCHQAKTESAIKAEIEKLQKKHGKGKLLDIRNMTHGTYQELHESGPDGCMEDCEYIKPALTYGDMAIKICTNPGCYNKLAAATNRAASKQRRDETDEFFAPAFNFLDQQLHIGRIAVIACIRTVKSVYVDVARAAVKRTGIDIDVEMVRDSDSEATYQAFEELAKLSMHRLLTFTAEMELQEEGRRMKQGDSCYHPDKTRWLLGLDARVKTLVCPVCGKRFSEKSFHSRTIDGATYCSDECAQQPNCPHCSKKFNSKSSGVTRYEGKDYCCEDCAKAARDGESTSSSMGFVSYIDSTGTTYFVGQGLQYNGPDSGWFTLYQKSRLSGTHRVKSPNLPLRDTKKEAQADLDTYAKKHGFAMDSSSISEISESEKEPAGVSA